QRSFVVKNIGNSKLTVITLDRDPNTPRDFSAQAQDTLPKTLDPMQQLAITVNYTAIKAGNVSGKILVMTNAWKDPSARTDTSVGAVALSANSSGPNVNASPSQVSFGTVATGMTKMQNVVISNAGNAPLAVSGIQLISPTPAVTLANLPALPLMIQPGN